MADPHENKQGVRGRFAPSPSGRMHAGNIYAALITWLLVKKRGGKIVLRIEDLDAERSKPEFIDAIRYDLEMLGLTWDEGPFFQSDRSEAYQAVFEKLSRSGLVYPCFCSRAQIQAMRTMGSAPNLGEGSFYPGKCRALPAEERIRLLARAEEEGLRYSYRLRTDMRQVGFHDIFQGKQELGLDPSRDDFIIKRSDGAFAYQLAVVIDDAQQGIDLVSRGIDLLESTAKQVYIQHLLGFKTPEYAHFPLFVNNEGKRLAKRDKAAALDELLYEYGSPQGVLGHIAYIAGLIPVDGERISAEMLLARFDEDRLWKAYGHNHSLLFG